MRQPDHPVKTIQSVHRAFDLLETLAYAYGGYRLGDLAEKCGLNKTTAFHLVKTLEARGYVEQSYDTQVYKLGWKALQLFADVYCNIDIRPVALPFMDRIRDAFDETVSLYYFVKYEDYYVGSCLLQMESSQSLKFSSKLGSLIPLHCTAAGKLRFLCYAEDMLHQQLQKTPFDLYTPNTTDSPERLLSQLDDIKQKGFCIEQEEYLSGICSVAVPLFKYTGRIVYSLSVSIPSARATEDRLHEIADFMMNTLREATTYPDFLFHNPPL